MLTFLTSLYSVYTQRQNQTTPPPGWSLTNTNVHPSSREGKIVPAEVTVGLLRKAMEASGKSRFLIDGFPRNPDNLAAWEASASGAAPVVFDFALFLDCPEEVELRRRRWRRPGGG